MAAPFIDTTSPAYDDDIHTAHREAATGSWYAETPMGYIALRYEAVNDIVRDRRWHEMGVDGLRALGVTEGPLWDWFHQIMSTQEGDAHTRLRRLVSQAFTPRAVERLRPVMHETAEDLLDGIAPLGRCEVVADFAAPYPVRVIGALLGIPDGDFQQFHEWSDGLSLAFGNRMATEMGRIESSLVSLNDYVDELLEQRRGDPGDDLISALIAVEEEGDRLTHDELRAMVTVLIFGGQDTTQCQIACAMATFLSHPDQWQLLADDPSLAVSAAEEVLRYEPAGSGSPRISREAFEFHGLPVEPGTIMMPSAPAANRDPAVYDDPDRFDITRQHPQVQLTFGGGLHYCLGAALARAELQVALPALARRLGPIEGDGPIVWRRQSLIRGPERVPIRFAEARAATTATTGAAGNDQPTNTNTNEET